LLKAPPVLCCANPGARDCAAMSIMEYNGGAVIAMVGKDCVGIAADSRLGIRELMTVGTNFQKIYPITDKTYVGLTGLATDVQTMAQLLQFRLKLWSLQEGRTMQPQMVGNLTSSLLYEKRFGPYFINPVVAGIDKENKPFICSMDLIGAISASDDFVCAGTASDELMGVCESFWRPDMDKDELFETLAQCMLDGVDRDCLSGWGGVVHIITPDEVITKNLKGRMD